MKKQTAVAFFADKLIECLKFNEPEAFEHYMLTLNQALEMEKEQIEKAWWSGHDEHEQSIMQHNLIYPSEDCNGYYNETYGQD